MGSKILLVLMVKNEGRILQRCLDSAIAFVDAVLVFDTGSSDNTLEIAHAYKAAKVEV
jgi:glycosyltransferase involved in cell wall biosynthesis